MSDAAALMDKMYRRQRHIYDASRKFYLLGRDAMLANVRARAGDHVLEIACGTGRNLVRLGRLYPEAKGYGLDVSAEMLNSARHAVSSAGLAARIGLAQGDAASFDAQALFGRARFDRIVISYALSMIPPWRQALAHALEALAPNGSLHIVDFGDQSGLPGPFRLALNRWLAAFDVTPRTDLASIFSDCARSQGLQVVASTRLKGYCIEAVATQITAGPSAPIEAAALHPVADRPLSSRSGRCRSTLVYPLVGFHGTGTGASLRKVRRCDDAPSPFSSFLCSPAIVVDP